MGILWTKAPDIRYGYTVDQGNRYRGMTMGVLWENCHVVVFSGFDERD